MSEPANLHCLCSDRSFEAILALQAFAPLPFDALLDAYTGCRSGCGSCIERLRAYVAARGLLIEPESLAEVR